MISAPRFSEKDPVEAVPLSFNFTSDLLPSETLTGTPVVTVTAEVSQDGGTVDPTPSAILNGPAIFDSTSKFVVQPVSGGLTLNDYTVKVVVPTTNPSKVLAFVGVLPVRAM